MEREIVLVFCSLLLGIVASLLPAMSATAPGTVALFEGATTGKRTLFGLVFVLGLATLLTPVGFVVGVTEEAAFYAFWTTASTVVFVVLLLGLAASMFDLFALRLSPQLTTKLEAVGARGLRGIFARGLVVTLLGFGATLPLAVALSTELVRRGTDHTWLCTLCLFVFAIGLGASTVLHAVLGRRWPQPGRGVDALKWLTGVGLGCLAFVRMHENDSSVREPLRDPTWWFGIGTGALLLLGLVLGGASILRGSKRLRTASMVPAIVGASLFGNWLPHPHGNAPAIRFLHDEEMAVEKAHGERRPLLVVFNAQWCCREIDTDTLFDPRVREEATHFVPVYVDATDDDRPDTKRLSEKYKVVGLPTLIVIDPYGREVARYNELISGETLASAMKKAEF